MYVCICKNITDNAIKVAIADGALTLRELRVKLGVTSECGKCGKCARAVLDEHKIKAMAS